jgi:hypothetical protein
MAILIRVEKKPAILRLGKWVAGDPALEQRLNAALESWIAETGGPALSDRDPEHTAAMEVARRLGARVVLKVRAGKKGSGVYAARRQMRFNFDATVKLTRRLPRKRTQAKTPTPRASG